MLARYLASRVCRGSTTTTPWRTRSKWLADDGTAVNLRPIWPGDAQLAREFVKSHSPETRYVRFMGDL
jgi:hypothetical protein